MSIAGMLLYLVFPQSQRPLLVAWQLWAWGQSAIMAQLSGLLVSLSICSRLMEHGRLAHGKGLSCMR